MAINFNISREEAGQIDAIVQRVFENQERNPYSSRLDAFMDLTATHCNGNPLNFTKLFTAPDFDFYHDIYGIRNCIDRKTGELKGGFSPRCSQPDSYKKLRDETISRNVERRPYRDAARAHDI